jgi:hypothetical protein
MDIYILKNIENKGSQMEPTTKIFLKKVHRENIRVQTQPRT